MGQADTRRLGVRCRTGRESGLILTFHSIPEYQGFIPLSRLRGEGEGLGRERLGLGAMEGYSICLLGPESGAPARSGGRKDRDGAVGGARWQDPLSQTSWEKWSPHPHSLLGRQGEEREGGSEGCPHGRKQKPPQGEKKAAEL